MKKEYLILAAIGMVIASLGVLFIGKPMIQQTRSYEVLALSAPDYYDMFECPCCGQPIDTDCCGMAQQRQEYVDELLSKQITHMEVLSSYAKRFGFDDFNSTTEKEIRDYIASQAGKNPPKLAIDKETLNLGLVKQSDGKVYGEFTITNTGKSNLIIDNMETSCMCTSASILYEGEQGPWFGMSMHGENPTDYSVSINPGDSAIMKVEYDPNAHGPQTNPNPQKIIRTVSIMSNDPDFQKTVRLELEQVP